MSTQAPKIAFILRSFTYSHLPEHLQAVSKPFCELAHVVGADTCNYDTVEALRFLRLAKDAAVRAKVDECRST